jgi:hypothetical protein
MSDLLFESIRVEGGVKFKKHLKGGASYNSLGTSGLKKPCAMKWVSVLFNLHGQQHTTLQETESTVTEPQNHKCDRLF